MFPSTSGGCWRRAYLLETLRQRNYSPVQRHRELPGGNPRPYEEFTFGGYTYYFTPGGFLPRKDPGSAELGGFFCGYLTDEVWYYRTVDG